MPVFRAIAMLEPDVVGPLTSTLLELGTAESWAARGPSGEEFWFIARPMSCSKWTATLSYCQRVGVDPGRVLAIGDGHNDLELLTHAHVSVAVRGGAESLLELADHVVDAPDQGGWAAILDLL
jgi:hydroxymethylpyrimidine pyrophosphatase-like HAD family hydrolase